MVFLTKILWYINPYFWIVVLSVYATRTITFMPQYKNISCFLKYHCFNFPNNDQSWNYLANQHAQAGDIFGVMYLSNEGLLYNNDSPLLWIHRANGFLTIGRKELAQQAIANAKICASQMQSCEFYKQLEEVQEKINNTVSTL